MTDTQTTFLSPADLAWIARLPAADRLTYDDVRQLRAVRSNLARNHDDPIVRAKDLRLLDGLLTHADEITERHHAPNRAREELRQVEDTIRALSSASTTTVGAERLARHSTRQQVERIATEAEERLRQRAQVLSPYELAEERRRVGGQVAAMRKDAPEIEAQVRRDFERSLGDRRVERLNAARARKAELERIIAGATA